MRGARLTGAVCVALIAGAICGPAARAAGGPADWMYEPTSFTEVHLTLPPASITALEAEPKEYVEGTFSLAETDGAPGTADAFSTPLTVGIELKGSTGSLRRLSEKAAFKVKFDKFVEGQTFLGLEKMTFNNMVQDPSMIHETVTYQAFHDMGVPAPHTGFTYLTVNGKSYGMHLNIETQDAQSVENEFGTPFAPPQHLYSGEYGADVSNGSYQGTSKKAWEALEVSEGKKKEKGDLEALLAAVEASTPAFSQRVATVADLGEMTKDWMVEKYVGNWDGYASSAPGALLPNNYYLYSDAAGKFVLMPWGTDQTWQSGSHLSFSGGAGVLFLDCLADSGGCRQQYLAAGRQALTVLNAPSLDAVARCAAAALKPWQELEAATSEREKLPEPNASGPENLRFAEEEVAATREFIETRPAELAAYLGEPAPTAAPDHIPCPPLRPVGGFPPPPEEHTTAEEPAVPAPVAPYPNPASPQDQTQAPTPPGPTGIKLDGWTRTGPAITLALQGPGPGRFTVRGEYGPHARTACEGDADATAAGTAHVACRFGDRFSSLLRRRWRRVHLEIRFVPSAGTPADLGKSIRLARR